MPPAAVGMAWKLRTRCPSSGRRSSRQVARADNSLAQDNKTLAQSLIYKPGPSVASSTGRKIQPKQCNATRPRRGAAFILGPIAMTLSLAGISMARLRRVVAVVGNNTPMVKAVRQPLYVLHYYTHLSLLCATDQLFSAN